MSNSGDCVIAMLLCCEGYLIVFERYLLGYTEATLWSKHHCGKSQVLLGKLMISMDLYGHWALGLVWLVSLGIWLGKAGMS